MRFTFRGENVSSDGGNAGIRSTFSRDLLLGGTSGNFEIDLPDGQQTDCGAFPFAK